ncbi:Translocon-associated protein subunit alpha [Hibiscus syriacus]|uniref:Translocon-associated protein subunit alpha n=1 Tax=Hibiscus syriacus TaxID=106335 RepID=A0A6A3CCZ6_HIBSY|nr:translocon-associated protein subunit alpha-like [Hibiscus syriacus]KAE8725591.1 Translocon-associated protein subunit alpha [Hibiscus syriacus]
MKLPKMATKSFRAFFFALLLAASPLLQVARGQSEADVVTEVVDGGDLGIVGEDVPDTDGERFGPAPGVETVCLFPKNSAKLVAAGAETELLVGMEYVGESPLKIITIQASVHLPYDHRMLVQNLTAHVFNNATVSSSVQVTFPYMFAVSKYLQPGTFDLVGTIVYEIDQYPYQNTFYNGTIEVVEAGGFVSVESVFLVTLGIALLVLLGLWLHGQFQRITKKTNKAPKVEVGTRNTDASMDEWLQGTAYTQSAAKSKKRSRLPMLMKSREIRSEGASSLRIRPQEKGHTLQL